MRTNIWENSIKNPEGESRVSYYAGARSAQACQQMQSICPRNSRRRFFAGITGCLCSVTGIRSKKSCIDRIFYSFRPCRSQERQREEKARKGFSDAISGALGRCAAQSSESEKYCINSIFHSLRLSSTSRSTAFPRHRTSQCSCRCCSLAGVMYSALPNSEKAESQLPPAAFLTS